MNRSFSIVDSVSVIDLGCHTGAFLATLPPTWRRSGIEPGTAAALVATQEHGVDIISETIEGIDSKCYRSFDVVTMFDVVEHLISPVDCLERALALLKPEGFLILSSGNLDSWVWRWLGAQHWYLQSPLHLSIPSDRFVKWFAGAHKCKLVRLDSIAHRKASLLEQFKQLLGVLHWGCRIRGGAYRLPQVMLQHLPGMHRAAHRTRAPWSAAIPDHLFAIIQRRT